MRILVLALAALALLPATAAAHPLGNFSFNRLTEVSVASDRVDVRYVLDQAEIPTFQQRGLSEAEVLARTRAEVARRLVVTVDRRRVPLRPAGPASVVRPAGEGGLRTTRVELPLTAAGAARRVAVSDRTFSGRVGWRAIVARPGRGTAVRSTAPVTDPTDGLRAYPDDVLESPADLGSATFTAAPGPGTVTAPDGVRTIAADGPDGAGAGDTTRAGDGPAGAGSADRGGGDALTRAFDSAAAGEGVLLLLLLTAFAWGALHALSPGHGKAMVAAYLVGARGTARHAVALGATVTITHTAGVFALGAVALGLSAHVLPEDLFPWLELASGLLVLAVGGAVLRSRLRRRGRSHHRDHHHDHGHSHGGRHHHHAPPERLSWRGLIAMGASAGLIPCPSALVVLLGAIAQGQIALGMLLIVAFSAGLAATLTALGLAVVLAAGALGRVNVSSRLATAVPTLSALLIVGVGFVLTIQAVPHIQ
jgi:nickel/cobalt transporter (NicO) family protein